MTNTDLQKHTFSLYVANRPGVLIRISLLFARRGFNIDSLVVSEAHDPRFSQMNIVASGDKKTLDQILKQLNKLVDVIHAKDYAGMDAIQKELALIKVKCKPEERMEVLQISAAFKCQTVDLTDSSITFQTTGSTEKLDALHRMLDKFGVIEIVRTGKILMARGEDITS